MKHFALCATLLIFATPGQAHDKSHAPASATARYGLETLTISNLPVTDSHAVTAGFVDRFGAAGTVILSFTYTDCGTLCPVTNAILAEVDHRMQGEALSILSVSIDPAKDTPEALARMAADLGASDQWVWLTAAPQDNRRLLLDLGVDVATLDSHDPVFLIGDLCSGRFLRIIGLPDPSALLDLARQHVPCAS